MLRIGPSDPRRSSPHGGTGAEQRPIFAGSLDRVRADVGGHEILFEVGYTPQVRGFTDLVEWAERLWQLARQV